LRFEFLPRFLDVLPRRAYDQAIGAEGLLVEEIFLLKPERRVELTVQML